MTACDHTDVHDEYCLISMLSVSKKPMNPAGILTVVIYSKGVVSTGLL